MGRTGYVGRGRRIGARWGYPAPVSSLMSLVGVAIFLFAMAALFSGFPPFFFFFGWMVPFFLVFSVLGVIVRGIVGFLATQPHRIPEGDNERELLEVLERHGEITPARAALETTLSVSEADRMLSELAKNGHIEVRAREGRLEYALWEHDRRKLPG